MVSLGKSKVWSKCAVDFVWYLPSLINRRDTARDRDFICSTHPEAEERGKEGRRGPGFGSYLYFHFVCIGI